MAKIGEALKRAVAFLWKKITQHPVITMGVVTLVFTVLAFPQVQLMFRSYREVVKDLGYQWDAESLEKAILAEDSEAVEAFVEGDIRVPERIVRLVMEGRPTAVIGPQDGRPIADDIVSTLSGSKNIDPSACEGLISKTQVSQPAWIGWIGDKPAYGRFFRAVCDTSAPSYARARQEYRLSYERQAAKMADLLALGYCRRSPDAGISCAHFYAESPRALGEARTKLEMIYRLDCAAASDRTACARIAEGPWELPPPNPATAARAGAVRNQCIADLKRRYSCTDFLDHLQNTSLPFGNDPGSSTLDDPLEIAVAVANTRLMSGGAGGGDFCRHIYEEPIQAGCEQTTMASISESPEEGN